MNCQTHSFEETQKLGEKFSKKLSPGDIVLLFGNLGSGKTTFVQGLAKGFGISKRIISPTFIIVRRYEILPTKLFYHIDLYRSQKEEDLEGIGIPEILHDTNAITVIEWPEKLYTLTPKKRWEIQFQILSEHVRDVIIKKYE